MSDITNYIWSNMPKKSKNLNSIFFRPHPRTTVIFFYYYSIMFNASNFFFFKKKFSLTRDIWQLWIFESTASLRVGRKIKHTCMIQTLKSFLYLMDQDQSPLPLPHLIFFPTNSLNFKGKKILLPISLFSTLNSWYDLLLF